LIWNAGGGNPGYTTRDVTFEPGWYYVYVVLHSGTDCDHTYISAYQHGTSTQEINLTVYGPNGGGS
jgi:hypothetical protein